MEVDVKVNDQMDAALSDSQKALLRSSVGPTGQKSFVRVASIVLLEERCSACMHAWGLPLSAAVPHGAILLKKLLQQPCDEHAPLMLPSHGSDTDASARALLLRQWPDKARLYILIILEVNAADSLCRLHFYACHVGVSPKRGGCDWGAHVPEDAPLAYEKILSSDHRASEASSQWRACILRSAMVIGSRFHAARHDGVKAVQERVAWPSADGLL
jgi:hypothetical protein